MSKKKGMLITCDRCGEWAFRENKEHDSQNLVSYVPQNYSDIPTGWESIARVGDVCPKCAGEYSNILQQFKRKPVRDVEGKCE